MAPPLAAEMNKASLIDGYEKPIVWRDFMSVRRHVESFLIRQDLGDVDVCLDAIFLQLRYRFDKLKERQQDQCVDFICCFAYLAAQQGCEKIVDDCIQLLNYSGYLGFGVLVDFVTKPRRFTDFDVIGGGIDRCHGYLSSTTRRYSQSAQNVQEHWVIPAQEQYRDRVFNILCGRSIGYEHYIEVGNFICTMAIENPDLYLERAIKHFKGLILDYPCSDIANDCRSQIQKINDHCGVFVLNRMFQQWRELPLDSKESISLRHEMLNILRFMVSEERILMRIQNEDRIDDVRDLFSRLEDVNIMSGLGEFLRRAERFIQCHREYLQCKKSGGHDSRLAYLERQSDVFQKRLQDLVNRLDAQCNLRTGYVGYLRDMSLEGQSVPDSTPRCAIENRAPEGP